MCGIVGYAGRRPAVDIVMDGLRIAVIHNGIIENYAALRAALPGIEFASETDTEVVAHLLARENAPLPEAMRRVAGRLEGAFTLLAVTADNPDVVVGARRNSPLVVGRGDGENFLASDVSAFIGYTRRAVSLGQDQVVVITPDAVEITDFAGNPVEGTDYHVDWDAASAEKGGYDHFMLKEIAEQPQAVADTLRTTIDLAGEFSKVHIVACGTAYHAGLITKYAIEQWARIPCEVELASEFRYRDPILAPSRGFDVAEVERRLRQTPDQLRELLDNLDPVRKLARDLASAPQVLFIGRHVGYPVALEGALKLKELAYMHAEGFAAGELKHGPIALIDDGTPVICVVPSPGVLHDKVVSNLQEVRARGARTVVIAEEGDKTIDAYADDVIRVPRVPALLAPLMTTVPLQPLACEIATARGYDVDQPRNLAKSVTVE